MPSNDTPNILSSPLGSGTPSTPTTAADVTYDNTDSGLTADDVQEAIDEVAGKIADLSAEDVAYDNTASGLTADDVQAAIDEIADVVSGKLVQIGGGRTETYTPSESETWAVKIGKLRTHMQAILENIEDDERIRITEIMLGNTVVQSNTSSHLLTNNGSVYGDFSECNSNASSTIIRNVKVELVDTDNMYISVEINNSTSALEVVDKTSTSNTTSIGFRYELYKLVS